MAEYNTADRKSIRAAEKAAAIAERERGEVVASICATLPGRRYVWDKLATAGIFQSTFSTDPLQMAFNEGQRNQGLLLLNDIIQWCPDSFILAMREHNERRDTGSARTAGSDIGERPDDQDAGRDDQGPADDPTNV